jgi:hypothetical protein
MSIFKSLRVVEKEQPKKEKRLPLATDKDSRFKYSGGADVMKVWRSYGFVPPSEVRNDYLFKANRDANAQSD